MKEIKERDKGTTGEQCSNIGKGNAKSLKKEWMCYV